MREQRPTFGRLTRHLKELEMKAYLGAVAAGLMVAGIGRGASALKGTYGI
jgi:hypothetical protein